jgi:thioredoxin-like negative regulator of GroEL
MADDTGPTTSYSDPFYDRLDLIAQQVRRQWALVVLVVIIFIGVGIAIQVSLTSRPDAAAASAYVDASRLLDSGNPEEQPKGEAAMAEILANGAVPRFRAKAGIDLADQRLRKGDVAGARSAAETALVQARAADDAELALVAQLSLGAVAEQAGDAAAAETAARQVFAAAAAFPATRLAAQLALARALEQGGRPQEAAEILEPLLTRNDNGARKLLDLAAVEYWRLKRGLAASATTAR